jgi:hypothetical protein
MSAEFFRTGLDLIENASLLMLAVLGFCYVRDRVTEPPRRLSVVQGLIGGALAILTMTSPIVIAPSVQVDSRDSIVSSSRCSAQSPRLSAPRGRKGCPAGKRPTAVT